MVFIHRGDARDLSYVEDGSVQCVVTSPPYWGRRRSGLDPNEIGTEDLDEYLHNLVYIGGRIRAKMADDGLCWFNIGDTASKSGGAGGDHNRGGSKEEIPKYKQGNSGLPAMTWCLVPSRIACAFQDDGWLVRMMLTWDKGQVKPAAVAHQRAPLEASEVIIMMAKQRTYRYMHTAHAEHGIELGNVWHFPPRRGPRVHTAPFPHELPRRCILLSTKESDVVMDPFAGSGTTLEVAESLGRVGIGNDLYAPIPSEVPA